MGIETVPISTVKHLHAPECCKIITRVITALYSFCLFLVSVYGTGVDGDLKAVHIHTGYLTIPASHLDIYFSK